MYVIVNTAQNLIVFTQNIEEIPSTVLTEISIYKVENSKELLKLLENFKRAYDIEVWTPEETKEHLNIWLS